MGLRERAEKLIADQDAQRAADKQYLIDRAAELLPGSVAEWAAGMGLDGPPEYKVTGSGHSFRDGPRGWVTATFSVDGFSFAGVLNVKSETHTFTVTMPGVDRRSVTTVADVAECIRELEGRYRRD